jgi:uncharacterized protein (TIGR02001 family)
MKEKNMKVVAKSVAAMALAALVAAPAARAAEATVGADVASVYVFRGVTLSDEVQVQPYMEVSGLPVDLGVWASFDTDAESVIETDFYGSYTLPVEAVDASVGYTEYSYGAGSFDREVSLGVGLDLPLAPAVGLYYMVDSSGGYEGQFYGDLSVGHDLEIAEGVSLSVGALVSYIMQGDDIEVDDGLNHYEVSASLAYSMLSAGVTYVGEIDDDVLVVDEDVVVTVGISHSF